MIEVAETNVPLLVSRMSFNRPVRRACLRDLVKELASEAEGAVQTTSMALLLQALLHQRQAFPDRTCKGLVKIYSPSDRMDHHRSSRKTMLLMAGAVEEVQPKMAQEMAIVGLIDTEAIRLAKTDKPEQRSECAKKGYPRVERGREISGAEATMVPQIAMSEGALQRWKATFEAAAAHLSERDAIEDRQGMGGGGTMDRTESATSEREGTDERSERGGMGAGVVAREDVVRRERTRGSLRTTRELGDEVAASRVRIRNAEAQHGINQRKGAAFSGS